MRRSHKWVMTLGMVAAAPQVGLAGWFDVGRPKADAAEGAALNQQVAESVAAKLRGARLKGADIEIEYQAGTLTLKGQVADDGTKAMATQLAAQCEGVQKVNNQMTVGGAPSRPAGSPFGGPVRQVSAESPFGAPSGVQSAAFESGPTQSPTIEQVAAAKEAARRPQTTSQARPQQRPMTAAAPSGGSNQQVANSVAGALKQAGLDGYDIEVRCDKGVCTLLGTVSTAQHRDAAVRAAQSISGVESINCGLKVAGGGMPNGVNPVNFQDAANGGEAGMPPGYAPPGYGMPPGYGAAPGYGMPPGGMAPGGMPPGAVPPPPPGFAQPGVGAVSPVYDQPNMPQYAWPSYAQHPNYAALTYPKQYSASAWPYIGPFYPYPQVPLGWREVELEWDDGQWYLDFNSRTDRWWWFMNPHNW